MATVYNKLKKSSFMGEFYKGNASAGEVLDFMILGKISKKIHESLTYHCLNSADFPSQSGRYRLINKLEFSIIKPVIENIVKELSNNPDLWINKPDLPYARVFEEVKSAKNEIDLLKALYAPDFNQQIGLKDWEDVRYKILDHFLNERGVLFYSDSPYREKLYLILTDAKKTGIKFDFDEGLIDRYVPYLKSWHSKRLINDDRFYNYIVGQYGTYNPTDKQIREGVLTELECALRYGYYEESISNMKKWTARQMPETEMENDGLSPKF